MNAPLNPALLAPAVQTFTVTIAFTDGEYRSTVQAATAERAMGLALTDARMSDGGFHQGRVLAISADRPP